MSIIDLIVSRHGKKQPTDRRGYPGDAFDRNVHLSDEGKAQAYAIGERLFSGKRYARVIVVTSGFQRTRETADAVLEGAGMDPNALYETPACARFWIDSHLGFGGPQWVFPEGTPKFGDVPELLGPHISYGLREHFLQREDAADGQYPIMARHAAAVAGTLSADVRELENGLTGSERGLLVVTSHAHPVDAAAAYLSAALQLTPIVQREEGKSVYTVQLAEPYTPHLQGEFFSGEFSRGRQSEFELQIKGKTYALPLAAIDRAAAELPYLAAHAVQRAA